jgi:hypothetical protein
MHVAVEEAIAAHVAARRSPNALKVAAVSETTIRRAKFQIHAQRAGHTGILEGCIQDAGFTTSSLPPR